MITLNDKYGIVINAINYGIKAIGQRSAMALQIAEFWLDGYLKAKTDSVTFFNGEDVKEVFVAAKFPHDVKCPYCGSDKIVKFADKYFCMESGCETTFDDDDIVREDIRHKISLILMDTNEDHQLKCDIVIGEEYSHGLSTLEMPQVISAYQIPGDGRIWFKIYGLENDNDGFVNFDDLVTSDLKIILEELQKL
jgi:hypothetical protein